MHLLKMKYSVATLSFIATYIISSIYITAEKEDSAADEDGKDAI